MHGHKVILAAGSQKFAEFFQRHTDVSYPRRTLFTNLTEFDDHAQKADGAAKDVCIFDLGLCPFYAPIVPMVLRHMYGLPLHDDDGHDGDSYYPACHWKHLYEAAEQLGVPSLCKLAFEMLDYMLPDLLIDSATGRPAHETDVESFLEIALEDYSKVSERTELRDMILKLCCKHYSTLRAHPEFQTFVDENPGFHECMFDYVAREGDGGIVG